MASWNQGTGPPGSNADPSMATSMKSATMASDERKNRPLSENSAAAGGQNKHQPQTTAQLAKSGGDRVRRWASRLLRGHSTPSVLVSASAVNGSVTAGSASSTVNHDRSHCVTAVGGSASGTTGGNAVRSDVIRATGAAYPPPLPPKQPRSKPIPPPRTSSCLSRPASQAHGVFDELLSPVSSASSVPLVVTTASLVTASTSSSSTPNPVKSVRFGQEVYNVRKDALAEATIGLEIAANLALAFARDVRRERLAAASPSPAPPAGAPATVPGAAGPGGALVASSNQSASSAGASRTAYSRLYPSDRAPAERSSSSASRPAGHELTLSEFYQLLKYVGYERKDAPAVGHPPLVTEPPVHPQPPSALSSANGGSSSGGVPPQPLQPPQPPQASQTSSSAEKSLPRAHSIAVETAAAMPQQPQQPAAQQRRSVTPSGTSTSASQNQLPPGYLTAQSFRQRAKRRTLGAPVELQTSTSNLQRRSQSRDGSYDNLADCSRTSVASGAASEEPYTLKTRSLPRSHESNRVSSSSPPPPPVDSSRLQQSTPPAQQQQFHQTQQKPVRNWNGILQLITQVLSTCDQYPVRLPPACSSTTTATADIHQPPPTQRRYQRPAGGSLSDSEEAYHRRKSAEVDRQRQSNYGTLGGSSGHGAGPKSSHTSDNLTGHQSYLASLCQRLQVEHYIVQTLSNLTAKPGSTSSMTDKSSLGFVECWGSPERAPRPRRDANATKIGLERALLRLDQRRVLRHPKAYQHHHWRITPAECNALFLCKMSDDDRLSLTTAVSDDDDGESESGTSPFRKSGAAASFNCTGAVRKAGFLSVKKWLLRKKHQVELARKRGWRGYWVCLKGTTLLFYPCDSREGRHVEAAPKHLIIVDGAIMQPIPEHPKRDFIFCLSTAFGDAYLFQAPCQAELDTWVNSIHSACAAAFARHRGKTGTLHLLQEEIFRLERSIESDNKLKHMAELQLSVVSEPESRRQIGAQIAAWEENLERLHCEQFRLRCYMASLQHGELPNPKSLLTHVSRSTKNTLNRLGVFTVSSFHAYICARSPSLLNNLLAGRGATRRRTVAPILSRSNSVSSRKSQSISSSQQQSGSAPNESDKLFRVNLPDGQTATVTLKENMTVEEFLASACGKKGLNPAEHFVRVKKRRDMDNSNHFVPHRTDLIESYVPSHEIVEICTKALYQVELSRNNLEQMWGFSVEAELVENMERQDELCVFVSRVEDRSVAMNHGIIKGDEIMVINGALVGDLDMMYIESVLQEELSLCLMIRSCRAEPPDVTCLLRTTDDLIDSLVCPPPPSDPLITDDVISNLIVPAPSWNKEVQSPLVASDPPAAFPIPPDMVVHRQISDPMAAASAAVAGAINRPRMSERSSTSTSSDIRRSSPTGSVASSQSQIVTPSRQLSDGEKLKKCISELVETERTYVKHLNSLLENYLEPLKKETFLSTAEITALFGNIQEIVAFQRLFLRSLEEAMALEPNFELFDQPFQFKNVLFAVGNAFLHHANNFKLYSSFCASHSKAQKVLLPNEGSQALQEFLQSRNPRQQHSSTLESYLIKPIQRILKYPLLLQQLRNLTDPASSEHQHLVEALKGMEKVAEHINEMQRIHEEYGAIFDHLFRQHQKSCKQPVDLSPGELLYYGGVEWLNISDFLGKVKKGLELHAMCFVFKSAVVFLCKERLRQKKKLMSVTTKSSAPEVEIIRYQVLIPVTEVQVRTAQAKDMEAHYLWELIHLKNPLHRRSEKVYHLSNSTAEFRNAFLKTIRQIIRESVRNMSIPPAKPAAPIPPPRSASTVKQTGGPGPASAIPHADDKSKSGMSQRHSAGNIDYDNLDTCTSDQSQSAAADQPASSAPAPFRGRSQTFGDGSGEKKSLRKIDSMELNKDGDPGVKSESEEDHHTRPKPSLGRTPNHLSLSTTSTLSTGSSSSQARLVQVSRTPQSYTPAAKPLGSPVWKPRDNIGESFTLPRPGKSSSDSNSAAKDAAKNSGYGTLGFPSKK